ncbi:MAG TPA: MFS transporter [Geminicoccaceae bacterium]|nr:MFS transporter [Geminicoccaceae bacterium]
MSRPAVRGAAAHDAAAAVDDRSLARFKWVIGTPYFVQGTTNLAEVPILYFIKFGLGLGDAGGQLFSSLRNLGWFVKPLWGLISDRVPLFGYRRKSWYVLMACLALVFWALTALLAAAGVGAPLVFLLTLNLAFATYAFVDVVCDALMVTQGRRLQRVGAFVNFQWTTLAVALALSVLLGGWLQQKVEQGAIEPWLIFLLTGVPPLLTAVVGLRNIEEQRVPGEERPGRRGGFRLPSATGLARRTRDWPARFRRFRRDNRPIWLLALFLFFWKFSPSIGYIERSYLIDERAFGALSFGVILSAGSIVFLLSILTYRWVVRRFPGIRWDQYLYAMIALAVLSFPLSFFLYLDPDHPWWDYVHVTVPDWLNPLPDWNRYQWFRLIVQTVLGFASIPAFIIPLTVAGETVKLEYAGMGYAFLTALSNVTDMFEGVVGAGLYWLFTQPWLAWLLAAFRGSFLDVARSADERTLVLELFVYISLAFTLLTIPFLELLKRELRRRGVTIRLGRAES